MTQSTFNSIITKYGKKAFVGFVTSGGEKVFVYDGVKWDAETEGLTVYKLAQSPVGPQFAAIFVYAYEEIASVIMDFYKSSVKKYTEEEAFK